VSNDKYWKFCDDVAFIALCIVIALITSGVWE
jgi:hypothetical protein